MPTRQITIEKYNPMWSEWFLEIKEIFTSILSEFFNSIEHVGSTSVPELAAKPIIDVDIVIKREHFSNIVQIMDRHGFVHVGDQGIFDREVFKAKSETIAQLFPPMHLYVCPEDSEELHRHSMFRNYLYQSPDAILEYSAIKKLCASKFPHDINGYIGCKDPCVKKILQKAQLWQEDHTIKRRHG